MSGPSTVNLVSQAPVFASLPTVPLPDTVEISDNGTVVVLDQEKKIRREIANSNERRRMQSINSGFQSLRTLLPHHEGEKLSKAAILQQTAEYIYSLEQEKTRLLAQNCHLKRLLSLSQQNQDNSLDHPSTEVKRKRVKPEIKDVMETRVEGQTDFAIAKIELIKEPEPIKIVTAGAVTPRPSNVTPSITIVPPQSVVNATEPPKAKIEQPKIEPQLPKIPSSSVVPTTLSLPNGETCRIILTNSSVGPPDAVVVPLQPHAKFIQEQKQEKMDESSGLRPLIATAGSGSSKQNLDSIVEAIKHLEGDHLFSSEDVKVPSEVAQEEVVEYSLSDVITTARPSSSQIAAPNPNAVTVQCATASKDNSSFIIFKNRID